MATTTGSEYDHITISDGTDQTVHYLKDTAARDDISSLKSAISDDDNNVILSKNLQAAIAQEVLDRAEFNRQLQNEIALKADEDALTAERERAEAEETRIEALFTGDVADAVSAWLSLHPEATTTVQDNSVSVAKLSESARKMLNIKNNVLFYGADNTGETYSDTAIANAIEANKGGMIYIPSGTYLISRPIQTYDAVSDALSIIMEQDTVIQTDQTLECLLDIGALASSSTDRYPRETYNRIISGGVFNATGCTYAILFEDRSIQYIVTQITCINCTNGIKVGRTSALSQDVMIRDSYICGIGSDYEGTGVVYYGNDNLCDNVKVYGFRKAFYIAGGGTKITNSHALAVYRNGTNVPNFETLYQQTLCVDNQADTFLSNVYCDGYYRFVDIKSKCIIKGCTFYNYSALSGLQVSVFMIYTMLKDIVIEGCNITILQTNDKSSVIAFDSTFADVDYRVFVRFMQLFSVRSNSITGKEYLYPGDIALSDGTKKITVPFVAMSNSSTITADTWYLLGYVFVANTLQNSVTIHIASEEVNIKFFVLNGVARILSATKNVDSLSRYSVGMSLITAANNYSVYGVYIKQTSGTAKVRNCYMSLDGEGFIYGYNTETILNDLITSATDPATVATVKIPRMFKTNKVSVTANAGETKSIAVTFNPPCENTPAVSAIAMTGYPQRVYVSVNQVSNTGFTLYVHANENVSGLQIQWSAFDMP